MQPLAQLSRDLPEEVTFAAITDVLADKYTLVERSVQTSRVTFLDSFDWRLFQKKHLCRRQDEILLLTDFSDRPQAPPLRLSRRKQLPRFAKDFPKSPLRHALEKLSGIRALLPQADFTQTTREIQVLNKDEKATARILFIELDLDNFGKIRFLQLHEIRGYNKWFLKLSRDLAAFGTPQPATGTHILKSALAAAGRAPLDYSPAFFVPLHPEEKACSAVKKIYRNLLRAMLVNEPGIIDDLDSEFLHDFRVAVRRTRSGLTLIKNVLEPEISTRFKEEFRYIGRFTGPVRDLDVYLLMEDNYKARLPEHLQEGLHYFFEDLAKRRRFEQKKLVRTLGSPRYKKIINDWAHYLEQDDPPETANALVPVAKPANRIIFKRFKRVLADGAAITPGSPDEDLHRLRIQGKKLRYCLEFFSSLYPERDMKKLIKQLKELQNNLGDFNDLSVQQEMLQQYLAGVKPGTIKSRKLSAAIGGLLTNLYHEHKQVRSHFEEHFKRFAARENVRLYKKIFG